MYVVKESLGLGHSPKPHALGFYSGKEEGGREGPSLLVQVWFLYREVRHISQFRVGL